MKTDPQAKVKGKSGMSPGFKNGRNNARIEKNSLASFHRERERERESERERERIPFYFLAPPQTTRHAERRGGEEN